jgi:hypothetical protein
LEISASIPGVFSKSGADLGDVCLIRLFDIDRLTVNDQSDGSSRPDKPAQDRS